MRTSENSGMTRMTNNKKRGEEDKKGKKVKDQRSDGTQLISL